MMTFCISCILLLPYHLRIPLLFPCRYHFLECLKMFLIVLENMPQNFLSIISMRICANVTGSVPSSVRTNLLLQSIHPVLCRMRSLFQLGSSQFSPLFMLIHLIFPGTHLSNKAANYSQGNEAKLQR